MTAQHEYLLLTVLSVLLPLVPAYILYHFLPSRTLVTGPFQGLNLQLSGAFGGYFLILLVMFGFVHERPEASHRGFEVWTVKGRVAMETGAKLAGNDITLHPSAVEVAPDGKGFIMDLAVRRDQAGGLEFPEIYIKPPGYVGKTLVITESPSGTVSVSDSGSGYGLTQRKADADIPAKTIYIPDVLVLVKAGPDGLPGPQP